MFILISDLLTKMVALNILKFHEGNVTIKDRLVVLIPVETIIYLHEKIEGRYGKEVADSILFDMGKQQTSTGSIKYFLERKEIRRIFPAVSKTGDPSIEMGREILKFAGWGDISIEKISKNGNDIVLKVTHSPTAEAYIKTRGKSKIPVCQYLTGLLEGVVEAVHGKGYASSEVSCQATGRSEACIFELKRISPE